jgi:hypothetical protein
MDAERKQLEVELRNANPFSVTAHHLIAIWGLWMVVREALLIFIAVASIEMTVRVNDVDLSAGQFTL